MSDELTKFWQSAEAEVKRLRALVACQDDEIERLRVENERKAGVIPQGDPLPMIRVSQHIPKDQVWVINDPGLPDPFGMANVKKVIMVGKE